MSQFLLQAKITNTLAKSDYNNQDKVLAEIIQMNLISRKNSARLIIGTVSKRLGMSDSLVRKTISELKKSKVLLQKSGLYMLNPKFIKI